MSYYQPKLTDEYFAKLRKEANANLKKVYAGDFRKLALQKAEPPKITANDIQQGHMVLELRQLRKLSARYVRMKNPTDQQYAEWEELDIRLATLERAFEKATDQQIRYWVRCYRKAQKGPTA